MSGWQGLGCRACWGAQADRTGERDQRGAGPVELMVEDGGEQGQQSWGVRTDEEQGWVGWGAGLGGLGCRGWQRAGVGRVREQDQVGLESRAGGEQDQAGLGRRAVGLVGAGLVGLGSGPRWGWEMGWPGTGLGRIREQGWRGWGAGLVGLGCRVGGIGE